MKEKKSRRLKINVPVVVGTLLIGILLIFLAVTVYFYFKIQAETFSKFDQTSERAFDRHYALIVSDPETGFWNNVYTGAQEAGAMSSAYVESFGTDLAVPYTVAERLDMAIKASVQGIIVEGDQTEAVAEQINKAVAAGIPVVTVMTDCYGSDRNSFVGVGRYDLGGEYGRQIIQMANGEPQNVLVLLDTNVDSSQQSILLSGISEMIEREAGSVDIQIDTRTVDRSENFSSEQAIREILLETSNLPDILVCLSEENTANAYQALVSYNLVGAVNIIGYGTSEELLSAIKKGLLQVSIYADAYDIGATCVDSLETWIETGHVSDYVISEVFTVNHDNVEEYLNEIQAP